MVHIDCLEYLLPRRIKYYPVPTHVKLYTKRLLDTTHFLAFEGVAL